MNRPSGLRDPGAAVRGVGAVALAVMGLVLLLAIVPLVKLGSPGPVVGLVVGLAVVAFVLCGLLRRAWAWYAALVVPVTLLVAGWWVAVLAVLGLLFGLMWGYVLHVRRTVSGATPSG